MKRFPDSRECKRFMTRVCARLRGAGSTGWFARRVILCLVFLAGCAADENPATQLEVTVTGDEKVIALLRRVRATVYDSDASDGGVPVQTHEFTMATTVDAGTNTARVPFSFSIARGRAARLKLVVEGYVSLDPADPPVVENKQLATFVPDQTLALRVFLAERCFAMWNACSNLGQTCSPEARACGPVPEAALTPVSAGTRSTDGGAPTPSVLPPGCPVSHGCSIDYPCTPTPPTGYVCLGQRAEWRAPVPGSSTPPAYEPIDADTALDKVTGLVWQRGRPRLYEGCSGHQQTSGDLCTADEAKLYCQQLRLGGRSWRVPSKPELESLIDLRTTGTQVDQVAFPNTAPSLYWTSSTLSRRTRRGDFWVWGVHPLLGSSILSTPETYGAIRCVSGSPVGHGTPAQRYTEDKAAGTVFDHVTGLTWRDALSTPLSSVDEGRAYCSSLGSGWRLPDVKELTGIFDAALARALPTEFASPAPLAWATAAGPGAAMATYKVDELLGSMYFMKSEDPSEIHGGVPAHARCVR